MPAQGLLQNLIVLNEFLTAHDEENQYLKTHECYGFQCGEHLAFLSLQFILLLNPLTHKLCALHGMVQ